MKKVFITFYLISLLFPVLNQGVLASSWDTSGKTIKEFREDISELKEKEVNLKDEWQVFIKEKWKITTFVRKDLEKDEVNELEDMLDTYYKNKKVVDLEIQGKNTQLEDTEELRKELLSLKIELYKSIVPYIDKLKLKGYLEYVRSNIKILEKNKIVKGEIYKEEKRLENRVSVIKEKIEENKEKLDVILEALVRKRLEEKINVIKTNKKYLVLSNEKKVQLFTITLNKLEKKKIDLESITERYSIIEKKIEIYSIAIWLVKETIKSIEN